MTYISSKELEKDKDTKEEKEVFLMPTVELIEREKVAYVDEMKDYLKNLKCMPASEARKKSQENLFKSQIIDANGEFAERYKYSRLNSQKKR